MRWLRDWFSDDPYTIEIPQDFPPPSRREIWRSTVIWIALVLYVGALLLAMLSLLPASVALHLGLLLGPVLILLALS